MDALVVHRARAGLSQAELAAKVGCDQKAISAYENGRMPSVERAKAIATALGCRVEDIDFSAPANAEVA